MCDCSSGFRSDLPTTKAGSSLNVPYFPAAVKCYRKTHLAYRIPQLVFSSKERFLSQLPGTLLPPEAERVSKSLGAACLCERVRRQLSVERRRPPQWHSPACGPFLSEPSMGSWQPGDLASQLWLPKDPSGQIRQPENRPARTRPKVAHSPRAQLYPERPRRWRASCPTEDRPQVLAPHQMDFSGLGCQARLMLLPLRSLLGC